MMFKKKLLASAMATAMVAGAMVSGGAQAIRISETGQGQALLGPAYFAAGAYDNTRIRVVNTDLTNAVKGRIVFRSQKHSDECLDMVLYLSPGDVAYVDVKPDPTRANSAIVTSDDDSILASRPAQSTAIVPMDATGKPIGVTFASTNPVSFPMASPRTEPSKDTCAFGHVEVTGVYAASGAVATNYGTVNVVRPMSKYEVFKIFDTPKATLNILNAGTTRVTNPGVANGADHANRVQLKSTAEISKSSGTDRIMVPFVALRDGTTPNSAIAYGNDWVITNPMLDTDPGQELHIGRDWLANNNGAPGNFNINDALYDIERALATNALNGFYVNATGSTVNALVTFPTKYRHLANQYNAALDAFGKPVWSYSSPWNATGLVNYMINLFDTQENTITSMGCIVSPCPTTSAQTLPNEVNYFAINGVSGFNPTSGWVSIGLTPAAGAAVVPAIGFLHYSQGGISSVTDTLSRR